MLNLFLCTLHLIVFFGALRFLSLIGEDFACCWRQLFLSSRLIKFYRIVRHNRCLVPHVSYEIIPLWPCIWLIGCLNPLQIRHDLVRQAGPQELKTSPTMVRTYTFAAMVAVTYAVISSGDHVFRWMAERQESKIEQIKLDRQAMRMRRDLLQELDEKKAATT